VLLRLCPYHRLPIKSGKSVTLVTAQLDALGFFHDDLQVMSD